MISLFQNLHLSLYLSLLPLLACIYLNNAWNFVLGALPLYVCLFKINRFMYSPIVSRFGKKASAKWLNVNVILLVTLSIFDKSDLCIPKQHIVLKFLNESEFWTNQMSEWIKYLLNHLFGIQIEFVK